MHRKKKICVSCVCQNLFLYLQHGGTHSAPGCLLKILKFTVMSKDEMNVEQSVDQSVEQNVEQNVEQTPEQQKAAAILRAKLPELQAHGLNFERRTGNFFTASVYTDDDGVEKVRRTVVPDDEIAADALPGVAIKRAALTVLDAEKDAAKLAARVEECRKALAYAEAEQAAHADAVKDATAAVMDYVLPERAKRETIAAKIAEAEARAAKAVSDVERLRQMLIAAGIDPDSAN